MALNRMVSTSLAALACLLLIPMSASAQTSSIAGLVRDNSGAVLPGVTVEASSPALIEKVRTVVTDGQGQYKIVDLRPGTYAITFTLAGFRTARREEISLAPNFTASVNADLLLGELQETITVTGGSPVVDVQNVTQTVTFSRDVLDKVPTNKGVLGFAALTPAVVSPSNVQDVGGSKGEVSVRMAIHGGKQSDQKLLHDGMLVNGVGGTGDRRAFFINPASAQEIVVELASSGSAQYGSGGVHVNLVPRDGGNRFNGYLFAAYTGDKFQANNLTADLRARGLNTVNGVQKIYDVNGAGGGPLQRDKLWFYTAHRRWGQSLRAANLFHNATQNTYTYTPDLSRPAYETGVYQADNIRLTWQASQRHKVTFSYEYQKHCDCQQFLTSGGLAWEAVIKGLLGPIQLTQFTWTHPRTDKLLFEAGATVLSNPLPRARLQDGTTSDDIPVLEQSTNFRYKSNGLVAGYTNLNQQNGRFSMSYVTGSHNFKTGLFYLVGASDGYMKRNDHSLNYTFSNGVPIQLTQFADPLITKEVLSPDLAIYAQDQWTVKRLTLNLGLRFEYLRAYVPASEQPAGLFLPARSFERVDSVPRWKDINPRFAASYDQFGSGRTALKVGVGHYTEAEAVSIAGANNPVNASINSTTRAWTDLNGNFIPDCDLRSPALNDECGPMSNAAFGRSANNTRFDPDVLEGWGKRGYNWQALATIQHELTSGVALSAGYFRTWYGNFRVTDNLAVTPADYDPYCITAPLDARLPGGGGDRICGLYNLNPSKFGQVNNLVTFASKYGQQTEIYNGADLNVTARLPHGALVSGGVNIGNSISVATSTTSAPTRSATNNCFVVDSPQVLRFCDVQPPYQTRFKVFGVLPLPWDLQTSANFQSLPGAPIGASYPATNADIAPSLGRNLSGNARSASIDLVAPVTMFEGRINQLDVRLTRIFRAGRVRIHGNLDVYNVLNASPILALNSTFGPRWLQATQALDARLAKFSAQLEF